MLRNLFVFVFALSALNAFADTTTVVDPLDDYIALEIEKLELEGELFGDRANSKEIVSIASIAVHDLNENIALDFNTADYLPVGFNAHKGMNTIDWDSIKLYDLKEDDDFGFDTKKYLPVDFNPNKGLICEGSIGMH